MMGYAQVAGSFTLDGSLVNQAPFEEVKRKGVVGGQGGGGVVGVESKNDGGLLGALGWGNIGESIGGLLGGGELSSIKEMRGIASSKSIPLLSTRQSILFVDLCLAPGESKSYNYSFTLPKGLPPTHRGKAIKVSYNLVIGTQRAATASEQQQIRHVDFPFRVLGAVNGMLPCSLPQEALVDLSRSWRAPWARPHVTICIITGPSSHIQSGRRRASFLFETDTTRSETSRQLHARIPFLCGHPAGETGERKLGSLIAYL